MRAKSREFLGKQKIALSGILIFTVFLAMFFSLRFDAGGGLSEFFVGVEVAYGNFEDLEAVVNEVKGYTNIVVLGLPEVSINRTLLDLSCNYIIEAGLNFVVLFTNLTQYSGWEDYTPAQWVSDAKARYGDKFVAVYRWDEPGGDQLDRSRYQEVTSAESHKEAAEKYVSVLSPEIRYYQDAGQRVLTADYGLYWFDYQAGYDAVLAEFGWNNSRQQQIAFVRGAARAFERDWGAIITWTYTNHSGSPYLQDGASMYNDLLLAYNNGAKFAIVFNYPEIPSAQYGILTTEHLDTLKTFWNHIQTHPPANRNHENVKTAYVLPANYGYKFGSATDTIWGLWGSDSLSAGIYGDVQNLTMQYGADFDIVYDDPARMQKSRYDRLIYWNGTVIGKL
jgi:hypothetical protein